jgi:acyl-CoA thioesterase-1
MKGAFMKRLRRIFCGIGAAAIIGTGFFGCNTGTSPGQAHEQAPEQAPGEVEIDLDAPLVCLGDSLTAGYGAGKPGQDDPALAYPAYLESRLLIPVINAGISGDTSADALERLDRDVLSQNPQIVIIELGANDFFQAIIPPGVLSGAAADKLERNLKEIIKRLDNGKRKIYVAKFYTEALVEEVAASFGASSLAALILSKYDAVFESLAASSNVEIIEDIWSGVWGKHMSDQIHPDAAGYELMADRIFSAIEPYVRKKGLVK